MFLAWPWWVSCFRWVRPTSSVAPRCSSPSATTATTTPTPFPPELTNSLVKAMVVMGGVGVVLGVLCLTGVFWQRYVFVLAFFDAFVICLFAAWLALCRHQVALFEDHMVVTPLVGRRVLVRYSDATASRGEACATARATATSAWAWAGPMRQPCSGSWTLSRSCFTWTASMPSSTARTARWSRREGPRRRGLLASAAVGAAGIASRKEHA